MKMNKQHIQSWDIMKMVLRDNFIELSAYILKIEILYQKQHSWNLYNKKKKSHPKGVDG